MKFLDRLTEAMADMDAPDLPDEDRWTEEHEFDMSDYSVSGFIMNFLMGMEDADGTQALYDTDGYVREFEIQNVHWAGAPGLDTLVTFSDGENTYNYRIKVEPEGE